MVFAAVVAEAARLDVAVSVPVLDRAEVPTSELVAPDLVVPDLVVPDLVVPDLVVPDPVVPDPVVIATPRVVVMTAAVVVVRGVFDGVGNAGAVLPACGVE
jgi:hypothetical protein